MPRKRTLTQLIALMMVICILFTLTPVQASATTFPYERIYWVQTADSSISLKSLREQVQLFSQELQANGVTTNCLPIVYGVEGGAEDNDIVLILDSSLDIRAQGYQVQVENETNRVTVSASDADGLFYGCRYVIKQLMLNEDRSVTSKTSFPAVLERGLSLDNGRKYFTVDWIKQMIRELSWAEMNTLVLHFTEEMGLGIESKKYPWLAGRDGRLCTQGEVPTDSTVLTQEQVKDIIAYAKKYHVEIIPSLDSPGHMNYIVKKFNENCADKDFTFNYGGQPYTAPAGTNIGNYFKYGDKTTAVVPGSSATNDEYALGSSRGIDISNEIAVAFTWSLITEYAELFREAGCTKFDIGGDELLGWGSAVVSGVDRWKQLDHWKEYAQDRSGNSNAVAYDAFMYYMNDLNAMLREDMGYTSIRMWNDDALRSSDTGWNNVVELDKDIDIWYWTASNKTPQTYVEAGHKLYNIIEDYNYYVLKPQYFNGESWPNANAEQIYNNWTPYKFGTGSTYKSDNILGSALGIWCDNPFLRTEDEIMAGVLPMIRAHGAKSWDPDANSTKDYSSFTSEWDTLKDCKDVNTDNAPDVEIVYMAAFRTRNVRTGGTAVIRLITDESVKAENIILTDSTGNAVNFNLVTIPNEPLADGKKAFYLKFTVSGTDSQTFTVSDGKYTYPDAVTLWTPAQ